MRSGPLPFPITWIASCLQCKADVYPGRPDLKICMFIQVRSTENPCFYYFYFSFRRHASYSCDLSMRWQRYRSGVHCGITPYHFDIALHIITKSPRLVRNLECQLISCAPLHFFSSYVLSPGGPVGKRRTLPTYHDGGSSYSAPVFVFSQGRKEGRCPLSVPSDPTKGLSWQFPVRIKCRCRSGH